MLNQGVSNNPYDDTRVGLEEWNKHIRSFGLGKPLGIDLPNEKGGMVPSPAYYDRAYGGRPWKFSNIYSISIGEGENLVVPLQMANFAATIANKGFYYVPHLVKAIGEEGKPLDKYTEKHYTTIDFIFKSRHAMEEVVAPERFLSGKLKRSSYGKNGWYRRATTRHSDLSLCAKENRG